jgi:hypothetical protein
VRGVWIPMDLVTLSPQSGKAPRPTWCTRMAYVGVSLVKTYALARVRSSGRTSQTRP